MIRRKPKARSNRTEAARTALGRPSRGYTATYYHNDQDTIGTELPIHWRIYACPSSSTSLENQAQERALSSETQ